MLLLVETGSLPVKLRGCNARGVGQGQAAETAEPQPSVGHLRPSERPMVLTLLMLARRPESWRCEH